MLRFRCEECPFYKPHLFFCEKLKHPVMNAYEKLFHGGAIGKYGAKGDIEYPSRCGVEKTKEWTDRRAQVTSVSVQRRF